MNRCLAFMCALLFAFVSVSSACMAAPSDWIRFNLEAQRDRSQIHASFRSESAGRHENNWSSGFRPTELIGLDLNAFYGGGSRPLRFALVREAGRLDCGGSGGSARASGNCSFTADPRFTQALVSHGIGRPSREQARGLMALDVRRALIDAVAAARYPVPTVDELMAMTAVGVTSDYIGALASAGYRPHSVDSLVQFRALGITPDWLGGLARVGYANIPADELMQLRALNISADYISGFERLGYRHLAVDKLVELKALNITPDFVRSVVADGRPLPSVDKLVEMKIFGRRR